MLFARQNEQKKKTGEVITTAAGERKKKMGITEKEGETISRHTVEGGNKCTTAPHLFGKEKQKSSADAGTY